MTGVGQIYMTVVRSLSITETKSLIFSTGSPGDGLSLIAPGDDNSSAFSIQGEPNMNFQILLPGEVILKTGAGASADEVILVDSFKSLPETSGTLSAQGEQILSIGATRNPLRPTQAVGTYTGSYPITIVY